MFCVFFAFRLCLLFSGQKTVGMILGEGSSAQTTISIALNALLLLGTCCPGGSSARDSPQLTWSQWHPEKLQDICKVTCGNLETMCVTSAFVT